MSSSSDILAKAKYWSTDKAFDPATQREIADLIEKKDDKELTDRFYRDLEFGTGGLRGIIGAGTARMNIYNIRKASTAFAKHLKSTFKDQKLRVALTHDSRRFSREFAEAAASTFAAHGIQALLTKELRPVPMLSYMVREYDCVGGVCVTASHNPPNYNGYKVYWQTGGQIVPPHDEAVIANYQGIDGYNDLPSMDFAEGLKNDLIKLVGEELDAKYYDRTAALSLKKSKWPNFKIVFTPLHGTAGVPVKTMLQRFGFDNVHVVPEQEKPDGEFPTVKFPNPEDPDALKMAVALGEKLNADLVLGTDPDCDRLGIVENRNGKFSFLNGNQIGCLLTEFVLSSLKEMRNLPPNPVVIKTIVTTDLQGKIAEYYGAQIDETLTGFKWICQRIDQYETGLIKPYRKYVCGGEESYGFLMDSFVRDKDGVSACALAAEMTAFYKSQGKNLEQVLDDLFRRHGVYHETLHTLTLPGKDGADQIAAMMTRTRNNPPKIIAGTSVEKVRDIKTGEEKDASGKVRKIDLPSSDVLQFILTDGSKISMRPSGTEPKIKFYVSVHQDVAVTISDTDLLKAKEICVARAKELESFFVGLAKG